MLGKIEGEKGKRVSEDEMAGWHYRCNEHKLDELGQTLGDGEGQGGHQSLTHSTHYTPATLHIGSSTHYHTTIITSLEGLMLKLKL